MAKSVAKQTVNNSTNISLDAPERPEIHHFDGEVGSSPSFGTSKTLILTQNKGFSHQKLKVWLSTVAEYPYKLAELKHFDYNLQKRWYVIFWAWDVNENRLRRKRLFDPINRKKSVSERIKVGMGIVSQVNQELRAGKVLGKDSIGKVRSIRDLPVLAAIDYVKKDKAGKNNRKSYTRKFTTLGNSWRDWLEKDGIKDIPVKKLSEEYLYMFFDYLVEVREIVNKTYNNYRGDFTIVINALMKRDKKMFDENPLQCISSLPVVVHKHAAFNDEQMQVIRDRSIANKFFQYLLFIQFVYYTLARPNEVYALLIRHIEIDRSRIFIPGYISKNKCDEYVGISDRFKEIIIESGILNSPPEYFIFGAGDEPGPVGYASHQPFWRKNRTILEETGLKAMNDFFSLYSFKHSGTISLYRATKDIKLVQRQCRHKTVSQTDTYLRDLGEISGMEGITEWKGTI